MCKVTHTDSCSDGGVRVFHRRLSVSLSICLFICTISKKTDADRITELDAEVFHQESGTHYFGVKMSKVKVTRHKNSSTGMGFCTLVSAGFFKLPVQSSVTRGRCVWASNEMA